MLAMQETWVQPLGWEDPWQRSWQPTPVFLLENPHGQRRLAGCCSKGSQRVGHERIGHLVLNQLVQSLSHVPFSVIPWTIQHIRPPCPSPIPRVYPNPCSFSQWCHPTISSSVVPFSSCPQSFPASGSFQMSQLFSSGGQSIGVSASTSALPINTQDWSPLGWTGWISLQSKGVSRAFSNTTVQNRQFFSAQLSL